MKEIVGENIQYLDINIINSKTKEEDNTYKVANVTKHLEAEVLDDVYGDLINCIRTRAIVGKKNHLYEKIFEVYLSGGWHCGWSGNYPNVALKVYYPKSS